MAGQPTFAVHISLTVSPKSVYLDLAERLLISVLLGGCAEVSGRKHLTFPYRDFSTYGCGFPDDTRLCTKSPVRNLTHKSTFSMRPLQNSVSLPRRQNLPLPSRTHNCFIFKSYLSCMPRRPSWVASGALAHYACCYRLQN